MEEIIIEHSINFITNYLGIFFRLQHDIYLQLKGSKPTLILSLHTSHQSIKNPFHCRNLHLFRNQEMNKTNYECFMIALKGISKFKQLPRVQIQNPF
jgi:hypothetical protein